MNETRAAPPDAAVREEATDPRISVVLQAPAGSGKTTVLTRRFLTLLECVDEPEEILAITFTRKAAADMRKRILEELAARPPASAKARSWDLLNHPSRLRIQTIDSFNFWVASQLPLTTRAGASLNVDDFPEEAYLRAARAALVEGEANAATADDYELLFERRDNRWDDLERLIAQMLQQRQHWFEFLSSDPEPEAFRARLTASLHDFICDALTRARALISYELLSALRALPNVGALGCRLEDLGAWQALAQALLTESDEWRRNSNGQLVPPDLRAALLPALIEIRRLPPQDFDPDDARALDALARVLRLAAMHLYVEFAADGRVDHTFVAGAARAAFREEGLPTDLALDTSLRLRHILVDEFQDVSISQFELLQDLVRGWEEGDGRTLFVVGDPMQSIYQFREAEVGLFLRIRDQGIGAVRPRRLHLTSNFRAVSSLVTWTNERFERLLSADDDPRRSAVSFTASLPTRPGGAPPSIECRWFGPRDYAGEAAAIAVRIAGISKTAPDSTIAILVQARAHAAVIAGALGAAGVKSVGVKIVPLSTRSVIRDLVALTRALHHLADRASWLIVLRAPWSGASLATLAELSRRDDPLLVWQAMADEARLACCAPPERARVERVRAVLARALERRTVLPLAEWLEWTWVQLGASDAYKASELNYARTFFAAVAERAASGRWQGPADLEVILKNLFGDAAASGANPVQIMTIHHAKGLEFDHVFVPALDRALNHGREPLLRALNLPRNDGGTDLLVAPVPKTGAQQTDMNRYIKHLVRVRAANEQLRLLYVACTRAKESLHLSGAPRLSSSNGEPHKGTLLARLWGVLSEAERTFVDGARTEEIVPPPLQLQRLRATWRGEEPGPGPAFARLPIAERSLETPEFSWVGETARHVGTVVHAALQRFSKLAALPAAAQIRAAAERYRHELARHGVPEKDLREATERVLEALTRTCGDERGRWILSGEHREAVSELPLTGMAAGRLQNIIIDRSFIDEQGTRWVIDYKTSSHSGADLEVFLQSELERYRAQLTSHSQLARALGPEPVRAALYLPLLGVFRELAL
jgi:ATP-dependent helicase/nuclease subunit A